MMIWQDLSDATDMEKDGGERWVWSCMLLILDCSREENMMYDVKALRDG